MQYEIYTKKIPEADNKVEWRWRLIKLSTNKALSMSAEGFASKEECEKSIHLNMMADYKTTIVTIDEKIKRSFISEFVNRMKPEDPQPAQ